MHPEPCFSQVSVRDIPQDPGTAPKPSLAQGEMVQGLHPKPSAAPAVSLSCELPSVPSAPVVSSCPSGVIVVPMSLLEALAPFQPQPSGMSRSFDSSNLDLAAQVWDSGIREHNKNKTPGTGTALGSFPVLNKWRVCSNSAPSKVLHGTGCDPVLQLGTEGLRGFV